MVWPRILGRLPPPPPPHSGGGVGRGLGPLPPFTASLPPSARRSEFPKRQKKDKGKLGWEGIFSRCVCGLAALGLSSGPSTPTLAEGGKRGLSLPQPC